MIAPGRSGCQTGFSVSRRQRAENWQAPVCSGPDRAQILGRPPPSRTAPRHPIPCLMRIRVNGEQRVVPDGLTVAQLVAELGVGVRIALERNRILVRHADWPQVAVCPDDEFEIVQFVGGGCGGNTQSGSQTEAARRRASASARR